MEFFRVYGRVIGLLRAEKGLAIILAISNVAVAGLQFYEPVLFGQVIDLLTTARNKPVEILWRDAREILGIWALVGLGGIAANMIVSLQADRMDGSSVANAYSNEEIQEPAALEERRALSAFAERPAGAAASNIATRKRRRCGRVARTGRRRWSMARS